MFMTNNFFAGNCRTIVYINLNLLLFERIKNSVRSMIFYFLKLFNRFIYNCKAPYTKK